MGQLAKQSALYFNLIFVCSSFTIIFPFYPGVSESKGIELWLVGLIFSLNPIIKLIATPFLGRIMFRIGRKLVVVASIILIGSSLLVLGPIEYCDKATVIFLSVLSRLLSGLASACAFMSITSIFVTDYPDKVVTMLGRMEASIGIGYTIGPLIGMSMYAIKVIGTLVLFGLIIIIFAFVAWKMLGEFRPLKIDNSKINSLPILFKPRIFLTMLMGTTYLFSYGLLGTLLETHLRNLGLDSVYISLCFGLQSAFYLCTSIVAGIILKNANERVFLIIGLGLLTIGYSMLGPWSEIYPNKLWIVIFSLPIISIGQNFVCSKNYIVFNIPYMQKSIVIDYGYARDDIIDDHICSYAVTFNAFGEIIGPIYAGFVSDFLGIEVCCAIASGATGIYFLAYIVGSGILYDFVKYKRREVATEDFEDNNSSDKQ
ncbi:hypothetical protein SteCoe_6040 [Stentor coeruleus]|uniref:Major facilitator superfamily (MFS) profile domain-containing protein n=1 Tax=Stentor coeruleus TaxID=5963 RepID=A0A1R2CR41_9CILI|nr:hypothetical protein SteCoe_6040 [Stentor coeruleus]